MNKPFDIERHKQTFINYLEVIILNDGTIEYATPSHQEKLISIACSKLSVSRDRLNDLCPKEYYFSFMNWLCMVSECIAVWNTCAIGELNEKQKEALKRLKKEGLYNGQLN